MINDIKKYKLKSYYMFYIISSYLIYLLLFLFLYWLHSSNTHKMILTIFGIEFLAILSIFSAINFNKKYKKFLKCNPNYHYKMNILSSYAGNNNGFIYLNIKEEIIKFIIYQIFIVSFIFLPLYTAILLIAILVILFNFITKKSYKNYFNIYDAMKDKYGDNYQESKVTDRKRNNIGLDLIASKLFKTDYKNITKVYSDSNTNYEVSKIDACLYLSSFKIKYPDKVIIQDAYIEESLDTKGLYLFSKTNLKINSIPFHHSLANSIVYTYEKINLNFSLVCKEISRYHLKENYKNNNYYYTFGSIKELSRNTLDKIDELFDKYLLDIKSDEDGLYFVKYLPSNIYSKEIFENIDSDKLLFDNIASSLRKDTSSEQEK